MAVHILPVTNGGAEAGDTSGWTNDVGGLAVRSANPVPFAGSFYFFGGTSAITTAHQDLTVPAAALAGVDAGTASVTIGWQQSSFAGDDLGRLSLEFLDGASASLGQEDAPLISTTQQVWTGRALTSIPVPQLTRTVRVIIHADRVAGTNNDAYFDAISNVSLSDGVAAGGGSDHLTELEIWTDFECAGGTKVSDFEIAQGTHPLVSLSHTEILPEHKDTLEGEYSIAHAVHGDPTYGRVLRGTYVSDPFREWRLRDVSVERREGGSELATFRAEGPHKDLALRSGVVTMPLANGGKMHRLKLIMTPAQWLAYILRNSDAPSWVSVGTVDFTDLVFVSLDGSTPWAAAVSVGEAASERENVPAYVTLTRNGVTGYDLNLVLDPAPGADTVPVTYSVNELTLIEREVEQKFATRVFMKSAEHDGFQMTLSENAFEVQSVATNTLTMDDDLLGEDDQVNGLYVERPDLTTAEILDSTAPSTIVVDDAAGIVAGDLVRIVEDAAGSDLIYLGSPVGQAAHGVVTRTLDRPDILPVKNLAPNGFLLDESGGLPEGWTKIGNPTVTADTSDGASQFGLKSWRVTALDGEGLEYTGPLPIQFSDRVFRYQYLTFGVVSWLLSGKLLIEMDDVTDPADVETYFDPETSSRPARTSETGRWIPLYVFPGVNFFSLTQPREFSFRVTADGALDMWWDAWIVAHAENPTAIPDFREGSGSNDLWFIARDYLRAFGQAPPKFYETRFADRNRIGLTTNEAVTLGGDAALTDSPLSVAVTKRIVEVRRNYLVEGDTEIVPERIPAHLADRFLGKSRPPIVKETPENVQPPDCNLGLTLTNIGDLVASWNPGNWHTVRLVDVTGVPGTGKARMNAGTELYVGRATQFVMPFDQNQNTGLPDPALIGEVMIESYNAWGKPGECYETATVGFFKLPGLCANLITDSSAPATFCQSAIVSGGASGIPIRPNPIVVPYSAVQTLVTKDVTKLTACHKGSSSGVEGTVNGFAMQLLGTTHTALWRMDNGTAVNAYGKFGNVYNFTGDKWVGVAIRDTGSASDVRLILGTNVFPVSPDVNSSGVCCQQTTTDFYGSMFQPGIGQQTTGGGLVKYHVGYKRPRIECDNLADHHLFVSRVGGHKYLAGASSQTTATQTGLGSISVYGSNDRGGGWWTEFQVRDSGASTVAVFHASDHPDGAVWTGDRYTFDSGGGLAVGVGGVIAVNTAGTLGLVESGKIVETDFETAPSIPGGYHATGATFIPGSGVQLVAGGRVVYTTGGSFTECVSEGVVDGPDMHALVVTGAPDIQAAIRVSFDDPAMTSVLSPGVGDGNNLDNFIQERGWTGVWPTGADNMTVEQLQIGAGSGQTCSQALELVIGSVCCAQTIVPPTIGLPPVSVDCLLSVEGKVWTVNDCASGGGVGIAVSGFVKKGPTCPDLDTSSAWAFEAMYFERTKADDGWILVRHDAPAGNLPPITTNPAGDPFGWAILITDEDPLGVNPNPGTPRASDGVDPQPRDWKVRVILRNLFNSGQSGFLETQRFSSVVGYDWCP